MSNALITTRARCTPRRTRQPRAARPPQPTPSASPPAASCAPTSRAPSTYYRCGHERKHSPIASRLTRSHARRPQPHTAEGNAVSKAITLAEITKRRVRGLHQNTQIGLAAGSAADGARSIPSIAITLSLSPLDASLPGCACAAIRQMLHVRICSRIGIIALVSHTIRYQPPLTDEELRAAWIFDDEESGAMELEAADEGRYSRSRVG